MLIQLLTVKTCFQHKDKPIKEIYNLITSKNLTISPTEKKIKAYLMRIMSIFNAKNKYLSRCTSKIKIFFLNVQSQKIPRPPSTNRLSATNTENQLGNFYS